VNCRSLQRICPAAQSSRQSLSQSNSFRRVRSVLLSRQSLSQSISQCPSATPAAQRLLFPRRSGFIRSSSSSPRRCSSKCSETTSSHWRRRANTRSKSSTRGVPTNGFQTKPLKASPRRCRTGSFRRRSMTCCDSPCSWSTEEYFSESRRSSPLKTSLGSKPTSLRRRTRRRRSRPSCFRRRPLPTSTPNTRTSSSLPGGRHLWSEIVSNCFPKSFGQESSRQRG
jgi:hypothetical protein